MHKGILLNPSIFFFLKKRFILKKFFWPWSRRLFRDTPLIPMPLNSADARSPIFLFLVYLFPLRLWWWEKSRKSTGARFFNINRKLGGAVVCRFLSGHRCGSARLYLFRSHSDFPVVVVGDFFSLGVLEKKKIFFDQVEAEKVFLARSQKYIHDKYRVITTQRIKIAKRERIFPLLFSLGFCFFVCCYTSLPSSCLRLSGYSGHGLASSFNVCPTETCFMSLKYTLGLSIIISPGRTAYFFCFFLKLDCGGPCESHSLEDRRWTVHLDRDLLHFLFSVYPHWFEVCNLFTTIRSIT